MTCCLLAYMSCAARLARQKRDEAFESGVRQGDVIRLKIQEGRSYREISRITNLSETNVGYLIHVGLKTIRERLRTRADLRPKA